MENATTALENGMLFSLNADERLLIAINTKTKTLALHIYNLDTPLFYYRSEEPGATAFYVLPYQRFVSLENADMLRSVKNDFCEIYQPETDVVDEQNGLSFSKRNANDVLVLIDTTYYPTFAKRLEACFKQQM